MYRGLGSRSVRAASWTRIRTCFGSIVGCAVLAAGFGCDLPRDPHGTLERVRNGQLRVGVTEHPPWTARAGSGGVEGELVQKFATELGARIDWVWGSEQPLLESLERYELDLVIGGLTSDTPWKARVGLTKPYFERERVVYERGEQQTERDQHVMAVAPGENRLLRQLERFLRAHRGHVAAHLERTQ